MLRKRLSAMFISLCLGGAALAGTSVAAAADTSAKEAGLSGTLSTLHAVSQWATRLSEMADKRAKSDLVKGYAREVMATNAKTDGKLTSTAQKHGIDVTTLDTQTEEGKSLSDRMNAEATLLGSLQGDAWDKEYMTLVTNTQQSVIQMLKARRATATDPDVKQLLDEMTTTVQGRLKTAQDIMAKIYGDRI